jgi:hypothetical protein
MIAAWSDDKIMDTNKPTPESRRALEEAENRRRAVIPAKPPKEIDGRSGPEPTRFGDWENKGIASDF